MGPGWQTVSTAVRPGESARETYIFVQGEEEAGVSLGGSRVSLPKVRPPEYAQGLHLREKQPTTGTSSARIVMHNRRKMKKGLKGQLKKKRQEE